MQVLVTHLGDILLLDYSVPKTLLLFYVGIRQIFNNICLIQTLCWVYLKKRNYVFELYIIIAYM